METRYWKEAQTPKSKKSKVYWAAWKQVPLPEPNPHGLYFTKALIGYYDTPEAADKAIENIKLGLPSLA